VITGRRRQFIHAFGENGIVDAALAFLLDRALEKKLKATRVAMSAAAALTALRTVHVVDFIVGPTRKWGSRAVVPALVRSSRPWTSRSGSRPALPKRWPWLPADNPPIEGHDFRGLPNPNVKQGLRAIASA